MRLSSENFMNEIQKEINNNSGFENLLERIAPIIRLIAVQWKRILIINTVIGILSSVILIFFVENYYDSTVIILPNYSGTSMLGGLSSLAAVAGLNVGESNPSAIYQKLIESETVLEPVFYNKYQTKEYDHPVNLIEYFDIKIDKTEISDPLSLQEREKFLLLKEQMLKRSISTNLDRITNILAITVRMPEQKLSSDIANALIHSLDQYVRTKRKSNATEQRIYIEERTSQVKDSLEVLEDSLKKFREQNRIVSSPQLMLEQARLLRQVEILQTVYIELTKQSELIKLEEVKDSPIINVQEAAGIPIKKSGPSRAKYLLVTLLFTVSLTMGWFALRGTVWQGIGKIKRILNS